MKNRAKKSFLKTAAAAAVALTLSGPALADVSITPMKGVQTMQLTQEWDKIFPQSNKVEHHKVTFKNRYGITLVGDLYVPKNIRSGQKLPTIAVAGAFGAVKEQSSGLYAQEMAERGFVTLALTRPTSVNPAANRVIWRRPTSTLKTFPPPLISSACKTS